MTTQVLEDGPVECTVRGTKDGLVCDGVGQADTRGEVELRCIDVQRTRRPIFIGRQQISSSRVKTAINVVGDYHRRLVLVAGPHIDGQLRRNSPVILEEDAEVEVSPAGFGHGQLITGGLDLAEKKIGNSRGGIASVAMVRDGAVERHSPFRTGGGIEGVELVLAE